TVRSFESRLVRSVERTLERSRAAFREKLRLLGDPKRRLEQVGQRVDELARRMALGLRHHVRRDRARLVSLAAGLDHLNPLGILARGYSVTRKLPAGMILKDASRVKRGDLLSTKLHKGEVLSRVEEMREESD
ncbi:MAG TPA: exodeoxyribonuclease VII large subunit, partial [Nitrospirota bacterium]